MVEHEDFKILMNNLQPAFKLPSQDTLKDKVLCFYREEKEKLHKQFDKVLSFSLILNFWTDCGKKKKYCSFTVQFIEDGPKLMKKNIAIKNVEYNYTGETLFEIVKDRWLDDQGNCHPFRKKIFHIPCITHVINLLVKHGLDEIDYILHKIRKAIKYRSETIGKQKFEEAIKKLNLGGKDITSEGVPVSWDSAFFMLQIALELRRQGVAFVDLQSSDCVFPMNLSVEEWDKAKVTHKYLTVFYDAICSFFGSKCLSTNVYFRKIYDISGSLIKWQGSDITKLGCFFYDLKYVYAIVAVLDPRTKLDFVQYSFEQFYGDNSEHWRMLSVTLGNMFHFYAENLTSQRSSSSFINNDNSPSSDEALFCGKDWLDNPIRITPNKDNDYSTANPEPMLEISGSTSGLEPLPTGDTSHVWSGTLAPQEKHDPSNADTELMLANGSATSRPKPLPLPTKEVNKMKCPEISASYKDGLDEIDYILHKIRKAIKYMSGRTDGKQKFDEVVKKLNLGGKDITSEGVPVRWDSAFFILQIALELRRQGEAFVDLQSSDCFFPMNLSVAEWDKAKVVHKCLTVCYDAICSFFGSKCLSTNVYFRKIYDIYGSLLRWQSSDITCMKMIQKVCFYFDSIESVDAIVAVFDPRTKLDFVEYLIAKFEGDTPKLSIVLSKMFQLYAENLTSQRSPSSFINNDNSSSSDGDGPCNDWLDNPIRITSNEDNDHSIANPEPMLENPGSTSGPEPLQTGDTLHVWSGTLEPLEKHDLSNADMGLMLANCSATSCPEPIPLPTKNLDWSEIMNVFEPYTEIEKIICNYIFNEDLDGREVLVDMKYEFGEREAFNALLPNQWITDEIINLVICKMTKEKRFSKIQAWYLPTHFSQRMMYEDGNPTLSWFKKSFKDNDKYMSKLVNCKQIFIPMNDNDSQWYLCVVELIPKKCIYIMDSLPSTTKQDIRTKDVKTVITGLDKLLSYLEKDNYTDSITKFALKSPP
nr:zinc finger bed domain-containing protein ricesleeper 2 [Quercus suber]